MKARIDFIRRAIFPSCLVFIVAACSVNEDDIYAKTDVVYGHKAGMALTFDYFQPKNSNGAAVIFINSGGFYSPIFVRENVNDPSSRWLLYQVLQGGKSFDLGLQLSFSPLLDAGFTVFNIRHGSAEKFNLNEIVADCRSAIRFIRSNSDQFGIDQDKIGLWGASAGGYLSIFLGMSSRVDKLEAAAPNDQLSDRVNAIVGYFPTGYDINAELEQFPGLQTLEALKVDSTSLDSLSIKNHITSDDPPVLIIYGDEDSGFITGPSMAMYNEMEKKGVISELLVLKGTGHLWRGRDGKYNTIAGEKAASKMVSWFQQYLVSD